MKKSIIATLLLSMITVTPVSQADGSLAVKAGVGKCSTWYYSVCNQSYVVDVSIELEQTISGPWAFYARIGHTSHPESADLQGPKSAQTGSLNYGFIGIKREMISW